MPFSPTAAWTTAALTGAHGCYRLELPDATWVDIVAAATAAGCAEEALSAGDRPRPGRGDQAVSLAERQFLPGDDGNWVEGGGVSSGRPPSAERLAEESLHSGDPAEAATWAKQAVALEPFRERATGG